MLLREFFNDQLDEKQVWARRGKQVVRKYRCQSGIRKNRIVATPAQCYAAPDVQKRIKLKQTKARLGARMARKARKTKRVNSASIRVQKLNKAN